MNTSAMRARFAASVAAALFMSAPLAAQPCDPFWRQIALADDYAYAVTVWDPDGPGPQEPVVVIGGRFTEVEGAPANRIATWDPATGEWAPLAGGLNGTVRALATLPDGDLVAAGEFTSADGVPDTQKIARWDGERWHAMGRGLPAGVVEFEFPWPAVYALTVTPGGELLAGGNFFINGTDPTTRHLAIFDGDGWRPLDQQISLRSAVQALRYLDGGDLVVGGYMEGVMRWDGVAWRQLGAGLSPGAFGSGGTYSLASMPSGEIIAGGQFYADLGGGPSFHGIAQWDGTAWRLVGEGVANPGIVTSMLSRPDGSVIVTGGFATVGGKAARGLARWDGKEWWPLPGAAGGGDDIAELPNGNIAIARGGLAIWGCLSCYADCDGDGELTFFDFLCFQNLFAAGDPLADCDGSGQLDFFDFLCFQNAFAAGCE